MGCRIAVDAMGGDHAPRAIVRGAVSATADDPAIELFLVGDKEQIDSELATLNGASDRVRVVHASQSIGMAENAIAALRAKKDSSLLRMVQMCVDGAADAVVTAGNTGACAAACQLKMRPLPCISRPGIAVTIPTMHGPIVLCDAGANIHAKPHHLYEYAVMASLYAEQLLGVESPRVAILSIGEESEKGTDLVCQTNELLTADSDIAFVGNIEGRDLFNDLCDVVICDGFVGNIVLKLAEGLAEGLIKTITAEVSGSGSDLPEGFSSMMDRVWSRHDYSEYGGAPLLGVDGTCIICHGRSNERAIRNAILNATKLRALGFNEAIVARLAS